MRKGLHHWLGLLLVASLGMAQPAAAQEPRSPLVGVAWLEENLKRDDVLVLDASPAKLHAAGHIPGAVSVDVFSYGGRELPTQEMERRIQSWGVDGGKQVVIYDQGGTYLATSLFFDLFYYGVPADRLRILDGGLARWQAVGGAVTKEATAPPKPGTFRMGKRNEDARVRLAEFLVASGDPGHSALVEALEPSQHFGGTRFFDRAGHVPNAIMLPSADFYNADKTFKSPEEIRRMLSYLGIKPEQRIYTHCGGGIAASVPFFAAKFVADYPNVKLYKESQLEWLRDDRGLPFWTYDAPNLVREKAWLNGWSNAMLRSFGVSKVSVIDIRPAASFKQAHVPFAINVPAEVFRRELATSAGLAEALGAAGVDVADEAVVVSDGGLNPESALAFVMLEKVGQKRVSVLSDSIDDWAFAGLPVDSDTGALDAPSTRARAAVAPTTYRAEVRPGIVVAARDTGAGLYPRVYVAAGRSLPAHVPDGKVVHVPYTELVDARGAPKAASDLWNILVKAGVPRYAEIISIADEPGEAAVDYFVLKLMGYPDVKMLPL